MRLALTTALIMAAAAAWADETPPSEAAAKPAEAPAAATEQSTTAETPAAPAATEDDKPFKVPPGYRAKRVEGKQMYCTKVVVSGSRFGKETCRTEAQLREIERQKEAQPELDKENAT